MARFLAACGERSVCARIASTICWPIVWTGLSEVIGSWKIIDIAAAAQPAPLVGREAQHIAAVEQHGFGLDLAGRARDQAHDRERGHALAAARFAHQPDGLAATDGKIDAVDGAEQPAVGVEVGFETADV